MAGPSALFTVRYNVPNIKDVSIFDQNDNDVYTLLAADREALPGGDVKITADSNGNITLKDTATTPNELFTKVPNETPIDNVDDLKAALIDPKIAAIIIDGDINLDEAITIAGYKTILGTGTITADEAGFTIPVDARLVLGANVGFTTPDNTLGGVFGTLELLENATLTDETTAAEGWAWANGGTGRILISHGDAVYEHGTMYIGSGSSGSLINLDRGHIVLNPEGIILDGRAELDGDLPISNNNSLSFTPGSVATIAAGATLNIHDGSTLDVTEGLLLGVDDTSIIDFADGAIVAGTKAGIVEGTISPDTSLKFDSATGTWIAA